MNDLDPTGSIVMMAVDESLDSGGIPAVVHDDPDEIRKVLAEHTVSRPFQEQRPVLRSRDHGDGTLGLGAEHHTILEGRGVGARLCSSHPIPIWADAPQYSWWSDDSFGMPRTAPTSMQNGSPVTSLVAVPAERRGHTRGPATSRLRSTWSRSRLRTSCTSTASRGSGVEALPLSTRSLSAGSSALPGRTSLGGTSLRTWLPKRTVGRRHLSRSMTATWCRASLGRLGPGNMRTFFALSASTACRL